MNEIIFFTDKYAIFLLWIKLINPNTLLFLKYVFAQ